MGMITLTCPHCLKERMTFLITGGQIVANQSFAATLTALCRSCGLGVALAVNASEVAKRTGGVGFAALAQSGDDSSARIDIVEIWPTFRKPDAPLHLPANIGRIFKEAETNRSNGSIESAGIMYGKALDVATQNLDDEVKERNLAPRLRKLAEKGRITAEIADWADQIKNLRNASAHEEVPPTKEEVDELANLTRMTLVYLFEMPERVRLMRGHKEGAGAKPDSTFVGNG